MSRIPVSDAASGVAMNGHAETNGGSWEEQFLPPPLLLEDQLRAQKVMGHMSGLILDGAVLRRVETVFTDELTKGLKEQPSSLQMENTYVPELPNGTEQGVFLALDLGGTNFRVLLLELNAGRLLREDVKQYHISDALRLGPGADLFNFLADCVHDFVKSEGLEREELPLGFTFSFPMKHHSISSGELITWTKSFKCSGMAGADVAGLLQTALHSRGLRVRVVVLLNDTTGTLVTGAMQNRDVGIGVILGTGSNGCYLERASAVHHWERNHDGLRDVVVDVEWGAFGDNGCLAFLSQEVDKEVDKRSLLARSFTFEKYIGGKYLGDLLTEALRVLAQHRLLPVAPAHHSLLTAHLSLFEEENEAGGVSQTIKVLCEVVSSEVKWSSDDALICQYVARVISNRAAQLVAVCISTLIRRMSRPQVAVAVDGSVYKRHPRLKFLLQKYIALLAPGHSFSLMSAEDGSGKGSALTAAIAARIAKRDALST